MNSALHFFHIYHLDFHLKKKILPSNFEKILSAFFLLAKKSGRWPVAAFPFKNKPTSFHPSLIFSPEG
jgi:hypothetical protein